MKSEKNIDRLFQEKLKDFEVAPPKIAWENIEKALEEKKKRRVLPFWFRVGSAAAILLLFTFVGLRYYNMPKEIEIEHIITDTNAIEPIKKEIKNSNHPIKEELITNSEILKNEIIVAEDVKYQNKKSIILPKKEFNKTIKEELQSIENNVESETVITSEKKDKRIKNIFESNKKILETKEKNTNNEVAINNKQKTNSIENNVSNYEHLESDKDKSNAIAIEKIKDIKNNENLKIDRKTNNDEEIVLVENSDTVFDEKLTNDIEIDKEINDKKWSIASVAGAVVLNSFNTDSSPLDASFAQNDKQSNNTITYGVKVGYKLNKKWSLQSGVHIVNLSYQTNEIDINSSLNIAQLSVDNYGANGDVLSFNSPTDNNNVSTPVIENEFTSKTSTIGDLNQQFGYVEVPLEVKYNLTNGKLGVNLVGGFSTLFLNNNSLQVNTASFSSNVGTAKNLNSVNFSGNLGLDVDYKINQNLFLNIAPMIKVQTNTFSKNPGAFKPYTLGVYTGLNYRF